MDFMSALRWCATQAGLEFPEKEMNPEEEMRYKQKAAQQIAIEAAARAVAVNKAPLSIPVDDRMAGFTAKIQLIVKNVVAPAISSVRKYGSRKQKMA